MECWVTVIFSSIDCIWPRLFITRETFISILRLFWFFQDCLLKDVVWFFSTSIHFEVRISGLGVLISISSMLFCAGSFLESVIACGRGREQVGVSCFSFISARSSISPSDFLLYLIYKYCLLFSTSLFTSHSFPELYFSEADTSALHTFMLSFSQFGLNYKS